MLDRCRASKTCPKIFETFGGVEFWHLRMSPNLVGTDAKADIPLPANVRRYFSPGTTHGGGRGGFSAAAPDPPRNCVLPANPNPEADTMRALMADLIDWVTKGTEPPPSQYPPRQRAAGQADARGDGVPEYSGGAVTGWLDEPAARVRFRSGFQLQRSFRRDLRSSRRGSSRIFRCWCRKWMRTGATWAAFRRCCGRLRWGRTWAGT